MQPKKPDPITAARRLKTVVVPFCWAISTALKKANHEGKKFPDWKENQIHNFVRAVIMFSNDLDNRYRERRIDSLGHTVRNLTELCIWTQYCNISEEKARTFYDDSVRDFREITEVLEKLYAVANDKPEKRLIEMKDKLRDAAARDGFKDFGDKYSNVRDAAKAVNKDFVFGPLNKISSKFAHPTSLVLNLHDKLAIFLDQQYASGEEVATACLVEIEKCVRKTYPDIKI